MKNILLICFVATQFFSCKQGSQDVVDAKVYFAQQDSGMQSGNVKFVEIESFGKKFKVWTKDLATIPKPRSCC
jgi:hypothetical protein